MKPSDNNKVSHEDFANALKDMDSYIDITVEDLMRINELAHKHARLREVERLLVKDLMTSNVITVQPDTPLRDAASILLDQRISGLPVVEHNGSLVGIATEADFLAALGIPSHHATHNLWQALETIFQHRPSVNGLSGNVADIMIKNVVTIDENQTLHDVIQRMKKHHIKRLVVTDAEKRVRGIVTRSNLVRIFFEYAQ